MSRQRNLSLGLGAAAVAVAAVAVPLAVVRTGGSASAAARVAPLSRTDRAVLTNDRRLIDSLPAALSEVPGAAARIAGGSSSPARAGAELAATPALAPLSAAVHDPSSVAKPLVAAYHDVLDGHTSQLSGAALASELETLQTVEGDIVPALRVIALQAGRHVSAANALVALEHDRAAPELAELVVGWQQVYGAFVLVGQAAAG